MRLLSEGLKLDAAIEYQALATPAPGIISRYFKLDRWSKALFVFVVDTMALAETVVAHVMEATSNAGAAAAAIAGATCTITANTNVTVATIVCTTVLVGDDVVINGVTFTAAAAADLPNQVFDQSGDDAADAASLAAAINHASAQALFLAAGGHVTAAVLAGSTVTLTMTEPGQGSLTVVSGAGTMVVATVQAIGYIEVEDSALQAGFTHVALRLVGAATINGSVALVRGGSRYGAADQSVAASDTDS